MLTIKPVCRTCLVLIYSEQSQPSLCYSDLFWAVLVELLNRLHGKEMIAARTLLMIRLECVMLSPLGPPGSLLEPSGGLLGPSWGPLGGSFGSLGAISGPPGALLGPSWGGLVGPLGPSWGPLGLIFWTFTGPWDPPF